MWILNAYHDINKPDVNLNTTQTLEYTKDKYNVKINKCKSLS
jgi:hypothetical protein